MTATNGEAPAGGAARASGNTTTGTADSAACDTGEQASRDAAAALDKRAANVKALLALAGFELRVISGEHGKPVYFLHRWAMHRELQDIAAVETFAAQVGAA